MLYAEYFVLVFMMTSLQFGRAMSLELLTMIFMLYMFITHAHSVLYELERTVF